MTKEETYQSILPQLQALITGEADDIANMANVAAVLHETFGFWWTGFYRVVPDLVNPERVGELVLGPFQGPVACSRIPYGKGVCGTAWAKEETIIVPDVHLFEGHIACSGRSQSEIVVPVFRDKKVFAVLDIDSDELNTFDTIDQIYLEKLALMLTPATI